MSQTGVVGSILGRYAATSLFLYDVLITLDDEISFVWTANWSIPKVIHVFLRYFGLAAEIFQCAISIAPQSPIVCYRLNCFTSTWLLVEAALADALLLLRVLALLKSKRRACRALKILFGVVYSIESALLIYSLVTATASLSSASYANNLGCVRTDEYVTGQTKLDAGNLTLPIASAPVLILNVVFLVIVLISLVPYMQSTGSGSMHIIHAIVRDGIMYFILICGAGGFVMATPIVFWNRPRLENMSYPWFTAISPIAAGRVFLNLRRAAAGTASSPISRKRSFDASAEGFRVNPRSRETDITTTDIELSGSSSLVSDTYREV